MTTINTYPCTTIDSTGDRSQTILGRPFVIACVCVCVFAYAPDTPYTSHLRVWALSPLLWFLNLPASLVSYCIICYPCLTSLLLARSPEYWHYDGDTRLTLTPGWIMQLCLCAGPTNLFSSLTCPPSPPSTHVGGCSFFFFLLQYKSPDILVILPSPLPNLPGRNLL